MQSIFLVLGFLFTSHVFAVTAPMVKLPYDDKTIQDDLNRILEAANLPKDTVEYKFVADTGTETRFICKDNHQMLFITGPVEERTSAFYKGLRELGFLFPHPLRQISPTAEAIKAKCGSSWHWKPTLKFRGFHLHTLHPSEWVAAFYQNRADIAEATIRWMARNNQNIFDLSLLSVPLADIEKQMRPHFELAQKFQIYTGVSLGIALNQQNSYKLLSLWDSYFGWSADEKIEKGLKDLFKALPLSYIVLEAGTSEFTPTDFEKTLGWLNLAGRITEDNKVVLFTKVHVSSNQHSEKYGNYNFLPQFAKPNVGILPHTVMFYGLGDEKAPMYGNKNFYEIRDFMVRENGKRPTWYYPETGYWVAMDVDIPLFLTDYLRTRAEDTEFLNKRGIEGQLNFTTGHALGYWMFDWNLALMADGEYYFDPMVALRLLGEDKNTWKNIFDYQKKWYKDKGMIAVLSAANLQDELSETHRIHDRFTMKQLSKNEDALKIEIATLKEMIAAEPDYSNVKDKEIHTLLLVNNLRARHALAIREALLGDKKKLDEAKEIREGAKAAIAKISQITTNYPDTMIFKEWKNPTAYQFGYVFGAATLYWWNREETQIKNDSYFPFKGNMYDVFDIVF
jgi:hypothetical protein